MYGKKFFWIEKNYKNRSLNEMAKSLAEYNTALLLSKGYDVQYSTSPLLTSDWQAYLGDLFLDEKMSIEDLYLVNSILNLNVYFQKNTEGKIEVPKNLKGKFDCLVSLAAGERVKTNPIDIDLKGNHYIIDISPTAIHKSSDLYKEVTSYTQLDIFNENAVEEFLAKCEGTKGLFTASNCFMYMPNAILFDVKARLEAQNRFINLLANDKIEWYVEMDSADGVAYNCVLARDIVNKKLDERFKVLPWI